MLVINPLVVFLSLPWAGGLGKKTKYFLKEIEVGFWLPAGCLSPVADSAGLETRAGRVLSACCALQFSRNFGTWEFSPSCVVYCCSAI